MAKKNQIIYSVAGNKNLRRVNIVITAQTLGHLEAVAAANGWSEKDLGRVVDKMMRAALADRRSEKTQGGLNREHKGNRRTPPPAKAGAQ